MGAHPIMKKHGGKIIAELISCIGRGLRDLKIEENVRLKVHQGKINTDISNENEVIILRLLVAFAIHAASVAHILCGARADDILVQIENGKYTKELVSCCKLIRHGSVKMIS